MKLLGLSFLLFVSATAISQEDVRAIKQFLQRSSFTEIQNGFQVNLGGYQQIAFSQSGDQWEFEQWYSQQSGPIADKSWQRVAMDKGAGRLEVNQKGKMRDFHPVHQEFQVKYGDCGYFENYVNDFVLTWTNGNAQWVHDYTVDGKTGNTVQTLSWTKLDNKFKAEWVAVGTADEGVCGGRVAHKLGEYSASLKGINGPAAKQIKVHFKHQQGSKVIKDIAFTAKATETIFAATMNQDGASVRLLNVQANAGTLRWCNSYTINVIGCDDDITLPGRNQLPAMGIAFHNQVETFFKTAACVQNLKCGLDVLLFSDSYTQRLTNEFDFTPLVQASLVNFRTKHERCYGQMFQECAADLLPILNTKILEKARDATQNAGEARLFLADVLKGQDLFPGVF